MTVQTEVRHTIGVTGQGHECFVVSVGGFRAKHPHQDINNAISHSRLLELGGIGHATENVLNGSSQVSAHGLNLGTLRGRSSTKLPMTVSNYKHVNRGM